MEKQKGKKRITLRMNPIKQQITNYLTGAESLSLDAAMTIQDHLKDVISMGIENDADAMIYAMRIGRTIYVVLLAGSSLLQDIQLNEYLEAYFADAGGLNQHLPGIVDYLYNDIAGQTATSMMLRSKDTKWRGFNPLRNIDEIYKYATT